MTNTFQKPGSFYRGNLHTHSDRSDGALSSEEVCHRYHEHGYDFIALTDHFIGQYDFPVTDTRPFRRDGFTTLLGAELHSGAMQNGEIWHLLAVGLPEDFTPPVDVHGFEATPTQETGPELARRAYDAGAFVSIVHPQWSGLTMEDARSIESAHAVEAYNHSCHVDCQRADGFCTLDLLLSEKRKLNLIATDDAHFSSTDYFGGWVMVKAGRNTPEDLLGALKAGDFYSSQGPLIHHLQWNDDSSVNFECSAAQTIIVQGHGSACVTHHESSITSGTLDLAKLRGSPWARFTVVDANGKCAFSNPHWF